MPSTKFFISKKGRLCVQMGLEILMISKVYTKKENKPLFTLKMMVTQPPSLRKDGEPEQIKYGPTFFAEPEQMQAFVNMLSDYVARL